MAKILGRGAPTAGTYAILGQEYIDELTGKRYICTKSAHVTSDKAGEADHRCEWALEGSGGGDANTATDIEVLETIVASGFVEPVTDDTGCTYTDNNENILIL